MKISEAKYALDSLINKARVHLYKPIQIAEILYFHRTSDRIDLLKPEIYRTSSRKWRDVVCSRFLGRISTSSARYQDDIFNENAIPPKILAELGKENLAKNGVVEAYIYARFEDRFSQMSSGFEYCYEHDKSSFDLKEFIDLFWTKPGLKRSIDKIYEVIVYSLFSALIETMRIKINITIDPKKIELIKEFEDFAKRIIGVSSDKTAYTLDARLNRVGVTNASDRGMDIWANFGSAIQIKHLSLTEELAENIVSSINSDRIVIVCKDSDEKVIISLLTQLGWKSKIQSVVTESDLIKWYKKALKGTFSDEIGDLVLSNLRNEIQAEFPITEKTDFEEFKKERGYDKLKLQHPWDL